MLAGGDRCSDGRSEPVACQHGRQTARCDRCAHRHAFWPRASSRRSPPCSSGRSTNCRPTSTRRTRGASWRRAAPSGTSPGRRRCSRSRTATSVPAGRSTRAGPRSRPGTFVNGFHETWPIMHAEDAYGLRARRARRSSRCPTPRSCGCSSTTSRCTCRPRRLRATRACWTCAPARSRASSRWSTAGRQARRRPLVPAGVASSIVTSSRSPTRSSSATSPQRSWSTRRCSTDRTCRSRTRRSTGRGRPTRGSAASLATRVLNAEIAEHGRTAAAWWGTARRTAG